MACKYCHSPTCFCGETEAFRGLGCRIGLSRMPCDFIGIMWRSLDKGYNSRKQYSLVLLPVPLSIFQWCIMMFFIMVSFNSHWFPGFPRSWLESGCTAAIWLHLLRSSWDSLRKCRIGLYHIQYMTLYEYIKIHFRGRGWKTALGWTSSDSSEVSLQVRLK